MRRIRFAALAIVSFTLTFVTSLFLPGTVINRAIATALCGVLSFNSTACSVALARLGDRSVAASLPAIEQSASELSDRLVAQRSTEFDDESTKPSPSSNPVVPPYPQQPGPSIIRPEFDDAIQNATREATNEVKQALQFNPCSSPTYDRLLKLSRYEGLPEKVKQSLNNAKAKLKSIDEGFGDYVYDEYKVTIDEMPKGVDPNTLIREMQKDLNATVSDSEFDSINQFVRKTQGTPDIGDIYDIKINPINIKDTVRVDPLTVDVVMSDRSNSHFIFSTIETPGTDHVERGAREFGFERNSDGSTSFYTRGLSRPRGALESLGAGAQQRDWESLVRGIGNSISRKGGKVRPNSSKKSIHKEKTLLDCARNLDQTAQQPVRTCRVNAEEMKRYNNMKMNRGVCVIQGPVTTAEGPVDGKTQCGTCNTFIGDLPPHTGSCDAGRETNPAIAFLGLNKPILCPPNWDSGY